MFDHVCRMGLEGIVSKRTDAPYRSGPSRTWLKSKNPASEAVRRESLKRFQSVDQRMRLECDVGFRELRIAVHMSGAYVPKAKSPLSFDAPPGHRDSVMLSPNLRNHCRLEGPVRVHSKREAGTDQQKTN